MLDADFGAVRAVELAAEDTCTAEQCVVALDFPAFNRGDVEGETPDRAAEKEDQAEKDEAVDDDEDEEVGELEGGWAEILGWWVMSVYFVWMYFLCQITVWRTYAGKIAVLPE